MERLTMEKLSFEDKMKFIALIVEFIEYYPDMTGDVYKALQEGLVRSLANAREERSDLAYGMITALELTSPKVWNKNRNQLTRFVNCLANFFEGAPVEKKLRSWLQEGDEK